jgi:peptidoglycan/LPS O-acetylase OafA/YrhL
MPNPAGPFSPTPFLDTSEIDAPAPAHLQSLPSDTAPIDASKSLLDLYRRTRYFPALDGLRALCVTLVMFNHMHVHHPSAFYGPLGVEGFFVLSGFLITMLMLREQQEHGRISLKAFYTRRFFRIIPVYLFTILLYGIILWAVHDPVKLAQYKASLPWLLTFMEEFRSAAAGNVAGHTWSLAVEEKFYLLWPLLVLLLIPFRGRKLLWLAVVTVLIFLLPDPHYISYGTLLMGSLLAVALSTQAHWTFLQRMPAIPDALLLVLLAAGYAAFKYSADGTMLLFGGAFALLVASLVLRRGWVRTLLEHPALVFVGRRSYSFYLIHVLVIDFTEKVLARFITPNWIIVVAVSFMLTLAGASVMHIAIELPCIALGRRLSKRLAHSEPISPVAT